MSESSDSSSSDEEYPPQVNEEFEKSFLKTLSSLKKDDPSIYDKEKRFFDESTSIAPVKKDKTKGKVSKEKPLFLKDYERRILTENEGYDEDTFDESRIHNNKIPYNVEQRQIKDSFKAFLNESDDEENLLKPFVKNEQEVQKADADYVQWLKGQKQELEDKATEENLKNLRDFWNSDNLDKDEAFLRDYILNKKFLDEEPEDEDDLSEDSEIFEQQENFEQEYNFRYESGDNLIRRFPRNVEDSLRRKDNRRSKKRAEVKDRKEVEKKKKREEINRQKKLKVKEISERLEQLKQLTGNETLAFNDDDILNDFDPTEHDKKMAEMYNDEFYNQDDSNKPNFDDLDQDQTYEEPGEDGFEMEYDEQINDNVKTKKGKKTRTKRKRERKKAFSDLLSIEKPIYDPKLHESYQKYMEEYYELDCEDFIEDLPCRFKYKKVEPNDFGLSVEEILTADDKELNRWSSIKKIYKIRSSHVEKNEAKIYKLKGQNESLKMKILPSLYKTEDDVEEEPNNANSKIKKNNKQSVENSSKIEDNDKISDTIDSNLHDDGAHISSINQSEKPKKRKRKTHSTSEFDEDIHSEEKADVTNESTEQIHSKTKMIKKSPPVADANHFKKSFDSQKPFKHFNKFDQNNKYKGNRKGGKFNRNHNFHDSRLSAYGINPKKFKIKS